MFGKRLCLLLLILPVITVLFNKDTCVVRAQENPDSADDDGEDIQVEEAPMAQEAAPSAVTDQDSEDDEDDEKPLKSSPDADTVILFTKPQSTGAELPAGKDVQFLVGFTNKGNKDFTLETLDASFRYPMDFSFYIQNFSTIGYNKVVKPKQQVSLYYSFFTAETLSSRPFGLTINLLYKDADGNPYLDAVFNETVNIVEIDEGLDGETFFLYVFLAACCVLLLVAGQQFLVSFSKRKPSRKPVIERGTSNTNDVDYDWLPKETLNELNKSPKRSPRQSPRQRKLKRGTGSGEE